MAAEDDDWGRVVEPYLRDNGVKYPWKPRDTYRALLERDALQTKLNKIKELLEEMADHRSCPSAIGAIRREMLEILDGE